MPKFRKKPVVIEAMQFSATNPNEEYHVFCKFVNMGKLSDGQPEITGVMELSIPTLEGVMQARDGDWIIKGVQDELYPCKPDIFEETYELVED